MMAAILNSAILDSAILHKTLTQTNSNSHSFILTQLDDVRHLEFYHLGFSHFAQKTSLIHSDSTWWWQPSWTLPCWNQTLPSWIQTPCYLLSDSLKNTLTATLTLTQTNSIWLKLIHSHLTWWWQPSWILPSNFAILDSAILVFPLKLTHTCQDWFPPFAQKKLHSFILTQLDDGSHLEFCHAGFRHCHLGFRHLVIFSQIHSKTLSLPLWLWLKLIQSD